MLDKLDESTHELQFLVEVLGSSLEKLFRLYFGLKLEYLRQNLLKHNFDETLVCSLLVQLKRLNLVIHKSRAIEKQKVDQG